MTPRPQLVSLLLLLTALTSCPAIPVNSTKRHGLMCYQCASDSRDEIPICDTGFWKLTTRAERRNIMFVCPSRKAEFCVKKVVKGRHYTHTTRGCSGVTDATGAELREGCTNTRGDQDTSLCLCASDNCNSAPPVSTLNCVIMVCAFSAVTLTLWLTLIRL